MEIWEIEFGIAGLAVISILWKMLGLSTPWSGAPKMFEKTTASVTEPTFVSLRNAEGYVESVNRVSPSMLELKLNGIEKTYIVDQNALQPKDIAKAIAHAQDDSWYELGAIGDSTAVLAMNTARNAIAVARGATLQGAGIAERYKELAKGVDSDLRDSARRSKMVAKESNPYSGMGGSPYSAFSYRRPYSSYSSYGGGYSGGGGGGDSSVTE